MVKQKETYIYKIERNNSCLMTDAITIRAYKSKDKNTLMHLLALNTPKYFAAEEKLDFDYYLDKEITIA